MVNRCLFDPSIYTGVPLGMFHCPICGEMVIAGLPHPDFLEEECLLDNSGFDIVQSPIIDPNFIWEANLTDCIECKRLDAIAKYRNELQQAQAKGQAERVASVRGELFKLLAKPHVHSCPR